MSTPFRRPMKHLSTAITRAYLTWIVNGITRDLATTRAHLGAAEEDLRISGPYARKDLAREVVELKRREEALAEELAYVCFRKDSLEETAAGEATREIAAGQRAAA